ncbi:MAG: selenocysteine-specific translation elongation factor [Thiobacillus sp.]|nr:selenocysteine-specific translation elongation factor [Thiobacillus sp.]
MIVGTAGHIDHGKTLLVQALTGVDTDRLKEEKARGISIELGYAYQPLDNGEVLGFIDVPGHERFIHTMLAGASGIDFGLLVVAADDGVMPQTREHLDILNLLGVARGAVALTKIDRVGHSRVQEVEREVRTLLVNTTLEQARIFPLSAVSGAGVASLRASLHEEAKGFRMRASQGGFRLAVDRSFSLQGIGTVVTGTVFSGSVRIGDEMLTTPGGKPVRVRSLHVQNRVANEGSAGQRCALNLVGADKDEIARGDWIVAQGLHAPTNRFDACLTLSVNAPNPLKHWAPVHLHLGASHAIARVALLDRDLLAAGDSAFAQLVLEEPIGALNGDAFILRDADARHTLGGGRILDPWGPPRRRRTPERLTELTSLLNADPRTRLTELLAAAEWGLDCGRTACSWNLAGLGDLLPDNVRVVEGGKQSFAFDARHWQALKTRLLGQLADYHQRFPDELGIDAGRARRMFLTKLPEAAFSALIQDVLQAGHLARNGAWLRLPDHAVTLSSQEQGLYERLLPALLDSPFDPPWVRDLARRSSLDEGRVRQLMIKLGRQGKLYQIVRDLFYTPEALTRLSAILLELEAQLGAVRAADLRDRCGVGRKRTVQILEFFDRVGYTRRTGETHRVRNPQMFGGEARGPTV